MVTTTKGQKLQGLKLLATLGRCKYSSVEREGKGVVLRSLIGLLCLLEELVRFSGTRPLANGPAQSLSPHPSADGCLWPAHLC